MADARSHATLTGLHTRAFRSQSALCLIDRVFKLGDRSDNEASVIWESDISSDIPKLLSPTELEALFYDELQAPLRACAASRQNDQCPCKEFKLMTQRFSKDILRYGCVMTELGVMVQIEPDILDTPVDAAHRAMLLLDMRILERLTKRF